MIKIKNVSIIMLTLTVLIYVSVFAVTEEINKDKHMQKFQELHENYKSINGKTFKLYWEDPEKLNVAVKQQMKKLFIDSFVLQYRTNKVMTDLTDIQIKNDLENYFIKSIEPRFINNKKQYLLCARVKQRLFGFIFWEYLGDNQVYVAELVISPNYWRQGLGTMFMKSIFNKKPNTKKIILLTERENHGAKKFYEAIGYKSSIYKRKGYDKKKFYAYEMLVTKK
ncbi:MAG: GNAT family N-acetyltransferase [Gammaproteobacteria bacterium]